MKHFHTEVSPYLRIHSSKNPFLECHWNVGEVRYIHLPCFMIASQEIDAIWITYF